MLLESLDNYIGPKVIILDTRAGIVPEDSILAGHIVGVDKLPAGALDLPPARRNERRRQVPELDVGGPRLFPARTAHLVRCFRKKAWVTTSQEDQRSRTTLLSRRRPVDSGHRGTVGSPCDHQPMGQRPPRSSRCCATPTIFRMSRMKWQSLLRKIIGATRYPGHRCCHAIHAQPTVGKPTG